MWSVECGVWNVECGMWSVKCGVWNVECGMWSVEFGVWSVECGMWSVECGAWNIELKMNYQYQHKFFRKGVWGCGCPVDTAAQAAAPTEPTGETQRPNIAEKKVDFRV